MECIKSVKVKTLQWTGKNLEEVKDACFHCGEHSVEVVESNKSLRISNNKYANLNDYLVYEYEYCEIAVVCPKDFRRDYKVVTE